MTFRDRIVVREIDIRALLCGRRPFEALVREVDVRALVRMLQNRP
jgi:methylglyoxal synthase